MGELTFTGHGLKGSLPPKAKCKAMIVKKINEIIDKALITIPIIYILSSYVCGKIRRVKHDAKALLTKVLYQTHSKVKTSTYY
jgi:hypothetical protein